MCSSNKWVKPEFLAAARIVRLPHRSEASEQLYKEEFFTQSRDQRLYWYMCGPTVYNHLGHAYFTFDILRKVPQHYFGYKVEHNNIDDKSIINSNEAGNLDCY